MTDTKDAAQVLRDAGWLVVEPGKHWLVNDYDELGFVLIQVNDPKTEIPDTIDWSHVDPKYRYMTRNPNGSVRLWAKRPKLFETSWGAITGAMTHADAIKSYRRGTVPWDKSLVCREDEE